MYMYNVYVGKPKGQVPQDLPQETKHAYKRPVQGPPC